MTSAPDTRHIRRWMLALLLARGGTAAVPIWMYYMREALRAVPSATMPRPGGLIDMKVNALTGTLTSPDDPEGVYETCMLEPPPRMPEPGEPGDAGLRDHDREGDGEGSGGPGDGNRSECCDDGGWFGQFGQLRRRDRHSVARGPRQAG